MPNVAHPQRVVLLQWFLLTFVHIRLDRQAQSGDLPIALDE